eukprot:gene22828-29001_t
MNAVTIFGHSAGGTLALYSCCGPVCDSLPFKPLLCVAVAPVGDLIEGAIGRLSDDGTAIQLFMGGEPEGESNLEQYRLASPSCNLPMKVTKLLLISGSIDHIVPQKFVNSFYKQALKAADSAKGLPVPTKLYIENADHFHVVNTSSFCWPSIAEAVLNCTEEAK